MSEGTAPGDGFDLLSDETRRRTLRALAERFREHPEDPTLGFADLRRQVGVRDSGNFNYHLGKLEGRFVTKTDDGYRLSPAGVQVAAALLTGVYGAGVERGPVELDDPCPLCGDPLTAAYADGLLRVDCPNDHVFRNALPPGAVEDRSVPEIVDLLARKTRHDLGLAVEHVCPFCYARLEWDPEVDPEAEMPEFDTRCARCGVRIEIPVAICLLQHPAVETFYRDHGVDPKRRPLWAPAFFAVAVTDASGDGVRVRVELDGETLEATVDNSLSVASVTT